MVAPQPGHVCLIPVAYGNSTAWLCVLNLYRNNFGLAYDRQFYSINFMVKLSIINVFKCGLNGMIIL